MKQTTQELHNLIQQSYNLVKDNTTWRHYKGGIYKVCGRTINSEYGSVSLTYYRIGGPNFNPLDNESYIHFSRPLSEWFEDLDGIPRFQKVYEVKAWEPCK